MENLWWAVNNAFAVYMSGSSPLRANYNQSHISISNWRRTITQIWYGTCHGELYAKISFTLNIFEYIWVPLIFFTDFHKSYSLQVCLGVLSKDENVGKDIIDIMHFLHQFVSYPDGKISHILSFGDELTCEREHNAQEDQRDGETPSKRLEGLVPCIADFHTFGNFLMVSYTYPAVP